MGRLCVKPSNIATDDVCAVAIRSIVSSAGGGFNLLSIVAPEQRKVAGSKTIGGGELPEPACCNMDGDLASAIFHRKTDIVRG
jgi:hypothetical protein